MQPKIIAILVASLFTLDAVAEIPYVFSSGDKASASEVNQNFTHLMNLNDGLSLKIEELGAQQSESKVLLDEKVSTLEESSADHSTSIVVHTQEISDLKSSLNTFDESITIAQDNSSNAVSAVNNVELNLRSLEDDSGNMLETISGLSAETTTLDESVTAINTTVNDMQMTLNDIVTASVCDDNRLTNTGKMIENYVYTSTGASSGDVVQLNGVGVPVYELPYWSESDNKSYTIALPLGTFSVYTNSDLESPCNNGVISTFESKVNLTTSIEYKIRSSEVDAIITTSINAKIKDVHTVFDLTYSVSNTVSLGSAGDTASFDIQSSLNEIKNNHEVSLFSMLDNVTITALP